VLVLVAAAAAASLALELYQGFFGFNTTLGFLMTLRLALPAAAEAVALSTGGDEGGKRRLKGRRQLPSVSWMVEGAEGSRTGRARAVEVKAAVRARARAGKCMVGEREVGTAGTVGRGEERRVSERTSRRKRVGRGTR
jgi:hypothetical protein